MMEVTFAPRGILQINNAKIIYRNFEGRGDKFNREGDRNFALLIPDRELADRLVADGWNVKIKERGEFENENVLIYLPVKVKFNDRGPAVYLRTGEKQVRISEGGVGMLDKIDILSVDLDISPYDWVMYEGTPNEKSGRSAYLQSIRVYQAVDRFAEDNYINE